MMITIKRITILLGCTMALSGCTSWFQVKNDPFAGIDVRPVMTVKHANGSAKIMYLLGRYYQGKMNYKKAIAAYEMALARNPNHVEVHNGLGVIHTVQGNHELALQHFHKAIELAPTATYLHNNLGYAYLIQGQETKAAESLKQALHIDPKNKWARTNLTVALERGLENEPPLQKVAKPEIPASSSKIVAETHNELAPDNNSTSIEISNGNGVTGMARRVSDYFRQIGFSGARLTNHQTFQQTQTEIYYRSGFYKQAEHIIQFLPAQVKAIESEDLRGDIHVKILLGQDFSKKISYFSSENKTKIVQKSDVIVTGIN